MKKLSKADIAGMAALIASSPDNTELRLPTWLVRGYILHSYIPRTEATPVLPHLWVDDENNLLYTKGYIESRYLKKSEVLEAIGEKEYYPNHYNFVLTDKELTEMKQKVARDYLRAEIRQALNLSIGENT